MFIQVLVVVRLGAELACDLGGHHEAEGALLGLGDLSGFHLDVYGKFK